MQWRAGAYQAEFAGHPDEPSHYVTALLVHQYVKEGFPARPMKYAESFYLHYPKVAIGHWPPALYVAQAAWMLVFSPAPTSVLLFQALLSALVAWLVFRAAAARFGFAAGLLLGLLYCALPTVQRAASADMAEPLLSLFTLLAALYLACFLDHERTRDLAIFGAFTVAVEVPNSSTNPTPKRGENFGVPLVARVL